MEYLAIVAIVLGFLIYVAILVPRLGSSHRDERSRNPDPQEASTSVADDPPPTELAPSAATSSPSPALGEPAAVPVATGLPPAPPDLAPQSDPPTFRVVALGLSGAGKTVLLSSLFHSLNYPSPTRPYHLHTEAAGSAVLAAVRRCILDTDATWPVATLGGREFQFDFVSRDNAGASRTILRMIYLEYGGEFLMPGDQPIEANLEWLAAHVGQAHALIGLIDGFCVRKLLLGEHKSESDAHFHADLQPMIGLMQNASCPIQLVVTKWDDIEALRPHGKTDNQMLQDVKRKLAEVPQIRSLMANGASRVRLIPVSAVGNDFARLDDGKEPPVKLPGGRLDPINADVPLCAVLPDLLRQAEASLDSKLRREVSAYVRGRMWKDARTIVALLLQSSAGLVLRGADGAIVFLEMDGAPGARKVAPAPIAGQRPRA